MSKPILQIQAGRNDAYETIKLDRESRKYIRVTARLVEVEYDANGTKTENIWEQDMMDKPCSKSFLSDSEFEEQLYDHEVVQEKKFLYCAE